MMTKNSEAPVCAECDRREEPCSPDCFQRDYGPKGFNRASFADYVWELRQRRADETRGAER